MSPLSETLTRLAGAKASTTLPAPRWTGYWGPTPLSKAQKTDLLTYRNRLNPTAIPRRIIEFQDILIHLAKDKTDQLYLV